MRKETTTICFGSVFTVISAVCEQSEESDRVGGISQLSSVSQKQVQLWWKIFFIFNYHLFIYLWNLLAIGRSVNIYLFFFNKLALSHVLVNCFSSPHKWGESLGMFLVESKEKGMIYNGFVCMLLWNCGLMTLMVKIFRYRNPPDSAAFQNISQQVLRPIDTSWVWLG